MVKAAFLAALPMRLYRFFTKAFDSNSTCMRFVIASISKGGA